MKTYDYRTSSIPACPDRGRTEFFKTTKAFRDRGIALRIVHWSECPRSMILTILLYGKLHNSPAKGSCTDVT